MIRIPLSALGPMFLCAAAFGDEARPAMLVIGLALTWFLTRPWFRAELHVWRYVNRDVASRGPLWARVLGHPERRRSALVEAQRARMRAAKADPSAQPPMAGS